MGNRDDDFNIIDEEFTLESILAEYRDDSKSSDIEKAKVSLDSDVDKIINQISQKYLKQDIKTIEKSGASYKVDLDIDEIDIDKKEEKDSETFRAEEKSDVRDTPVEAEVRDETEKPEIHSPTDSSIPVYKTNFSAKDEEKANEVSEPEISTPERVTQRESAVADKAETFSPVPETGEEIEKKHSVPPIQADTKPASEKEPVISEETLNSKELLLSSIEKTADEANANNDNNIKSLAENFKKRFNRVNRNKAEPPQSEDISSAVTETKVTEQPDVTLEKSNVQEAKPASDITDSEPEIEAATAHSDISDSEDFNEDKHNFQIEAEAEEVTASGMQQKVVDFKLPTMNDAVGNKPKKVPKSKRKPSSSNVESEDFAPISVEVTDESSNVTEYEKYAAQFSGNEHADEDKDALDKDNTGGKDGLFSRFLGMLSTEEPEPEDDNLEYTPRPYIPPRHEPRDNSGEDAHAAEFEEQEPVEEGQYDTEDLELDSTTPVLASIQYAKGLGSLHIKGIVSIVMSLIMMMMCLSYESSFPFPIDFSNNPASLAATLLTFQLIVMLIGLEVISRGLLNIIFLEIGSESLLTIASIVTIGDCVQIMLTNTVNAGLPFSAVIAFAMGCYLLGIKLTKNALKISLKTASLSSNPYIVGSSRGYDSDDLLLIKARREPEGFLRKCQQMDYCEHTYNLITPILLLMAVLFSIIASVSNGTSENLLHYLSAMMTVSVSFSALIAYGLPYSMLSKKLSKVGAAIGGWGGACDIDESVGGVITDHDVFPSGTQSISGIRVFRKTDTSKVISYTASIIAESGSGLSEAFIELVRKQGYTFYPISDFACYEGGGIGATINGDEVIVGSSNFMNLMGIRLPNNLNVKNAVFTAVRGELVGVFSINYVPINSVQEALISIFRSKIQPLFAIRDFNVSPLMLQHKFKISTDKIEFLSFEDRYQISSLVPSEDTKPAAILCREGLGPFADVVMGGKKLKKAVRNSVIFSVVGSVLGLLIMFYLCFVGSHMSASPTNMFLFMLLWMIPVIVISRSVIFE